MEVTLLLAVPVAILTRAITTEELFREPREWLAAGHKACRRRMEKAGGWRAKAGWWFLAKLCYLLTCDFCTSFYVSVLVVWPFAGHALVYGDWRGTALAIFVAMGVANVYLALYALARVDLRKERNLADLAERAKNDGRAVGCNMPPM